MDNQLYAVIMAGGGGTRLWPLSRQHHPKQTLSLIEDRTLFQTSVDRLLPLMPLERIFVVTASDQVEALAAQYPQLPRDNFIVEPQGRGTASCIGLAALHVYHLDPEAVMIVVTADHHVEEEVAFSACLAAATEVARQDYLVTLGITPTFPSTGYGYIRQGARLGEVNGFTYFEVEQFTEKPTSTKARSFVEAGVYAWNSGMFIWKTERVLDEIQNLMPDLHKVLEELDEVWGTATYQTRLNQLWPTLEKETIDYGIMEKAHRVAVIPADIGWSDIGTWASVMDIYDADEEDNVLLGDVLNLDSNKTMVLSHGKRLIAVVGLEDLIIVDTPDALLITRHDKSQRVKEIVQALRSQQREDML